MLSYYVSLRSDFRVVMSVLISVKKRCSVLVCLQLCVGWVVSSLRYLCYVAYGGVQHILCCVSVLFVFVVCPTLLGSLFMFDCPLTFN